MAGSRRQLAGELRSLGNVAPSGRDGVLTRGERARSAGASPGLLEADYVVVETGWRILVENWMREYVVKANAGGIERALLP